MAGGMALAERMKHACYPEITDHHTYVIVGDGCLMEGISHEAASFAGHLGLGRLIVLWDDNSITIDGGVDRSCSDDQLARFAAYGWHTEAVLDGRFVLSAGHGSALLYGLLHIFGYDLPEAELRRFRQLTPQCPAPPAAWSQPTADRRPDVPPAPGRLRAM